MAEKIYDVVVVGAGSAGMTAATYASRRNLKTIILTKDVGGQTNTTSNVENYPGSEPIDGSSLMRKFEEQTRNFGAEIVYEGVESIEKLGEKDFRVITSVNTYRCKAVILAFGKTPRMMNVKGEKEFTNKGVSYCITCDGPLFRGKTVAIAGNSNLVLEGAEILNDMRCKVYVINSLSEFRNAGENIKKLKSCGVEFVMNSAVKEAKGDKFLRSIVVENIATKKTSSLDVSGLFVELGFESKTEFVKDLVERDKLNQIVINNLCETKTAGIFAAGDVTNTPFKQIVISAGEGAKAALQCYNYIKGVKTVISADWASLTKEKN
ncbi:MAG: FAD-dependent oxidoreductase [Candidatus Aenigmatarchaeota archaeon]